jgi:hypothetical protein
LRVRGRRNQQQGRHNLQSAHSECLVGLRGIRGRFPVVNPYAK